MHSHCCNHSTVLATELSVSPPAKFVCSLSFDLTTDVSNHDRENTSRLAGCVGLNVASCCDGSVSTKAKDLVTSIMDFGSDLVLGGVQLCFR